MNQIQTVQQITLAATTIKQIFAAASGNESMGFYCLARRLEKEFGTSAHRPIVMSSAHSVTIKFWDHTTACIAFSQSWGYINTTGIAVDVVFESAPGADAYYCICSDAFKTVPQIIRWINSRRRRCTTMQKAVAAE
jgi:hypothetical protein